MAQQTVNPPPFGAAFTTGDSAEKGDTPNALVTKLQSMLTELYGKALAAAKYVKNTTVGATTAAAGDLTGALTVTAEYSAVGAAALTTRTATQMFADASAVIGQSYELAIMNSSGGTTTLTAGTGVTLTGTMTLATNTVRWFVVTFNTATTLTIQNAGSGPI